MVKLPSDVTTCTCGEAAVAAGCRRGFAGALSAATGWVESRRYEQTEDQ